MTARRIKENSIKGLLLFSLFSALSLKSCSVSAQSSRDARDLQIYEKVQSWKDSVRKLNPRKRPIYLGGEVSLAFPQYDLKSNIAQLNGLHVNYIGTNLGGVLANPITKLKANVGMYYSGSSVPYTMNLLQAGASASVYLLRLKQVTYHSFEPYATIGFTYQQTKFYGNYLPTDENNRSTQGNYSTTEAPLLGRIASDQMNIGAGVEYQLESSNDKFMHFFAEINYGVQLSQHASTTHFSGTNIANSTSITVGVSLGILK